MTKLLPLVFFLLFSAVAVSSSCPDNALWCDEFNEAGEPNPRHWEYDLGNNNGWGNEEFQIYTKDNAHVKDGKLHIDVTREGSDFFSSRLRTQDKVAFRYVTLEASIQIPDLTGGLWPAFWTLGGNYANVSWPECGEMDIAEWGSKKALELDELHTFVSSAAHWEDTGHIYENDGITADTPLHEDFHLYKLDWTPSKISMYVDDELVFTKDVSDLEEFQLPHFLIFNVAVGGTYTGIFNPTSKGGTMLVDWVRVYDNGSEDFNSSITCEGGCSSSPHSRWSTISWGAGMPFLLGSLLVSWILL
jgi:beta-glucanase (GH16 family)